MQVGVSSYLKRKFAALHIGILEILATRMDAKLQITSPADHDPPTGFHMGDTTLHCPSNAGLSIQVLYSQPELYTISEWIHFMNTLYNGVFFMLHFAIKGKTLRMQKRDEWIHLRRDTPVSVNRRQAHEL